MFLITFQMFILMQSKQMLLYVRSVWNRHLGSEIYESFKSPYNRLNFHEAFE